MNIESSFAPLLDLLLKSAALVLFGTGLLASIRKTSAANRHAVSVAIFAGLLLLPLTKLLPARWSFSIERPAAPVKKMRLPLIVSEPSSDQRESAQPVANVPQLPARTPLVIPWKKVALSVWLGGAALLLVGRAIVAMRLRSMVRGSFPIEDDRLAAKVRSLMTTSDVRAEVRESERCPVPLASGIVRPVVLLPAEAAEWSDAYISSALRHELGHIRRRDCVTRLLADVLCALYWVNPLVWFAARQMRLAQEQACDDLVLNAGAPADEYAEQLVEVVRSLQDDRFTARHALAMAQPSTLETRVRAIVDESRDRSARSVRGAFAGITFLAASLALCTAAQLRGADEKKAAPAADVNAPLRKQIEIAAKFIEITGEDEALPDSLKLLRNKDIPAASVIGMLTAEQAADAMKALNKVKGADLLSSPRITTRSGQQAVIEIVREFRYPTEWDRDAKSGSWKPVKFETKNIGVSFSVEAVDADGVIDLQMTPEVVEFNGWRDLDGDAKVLIGKPDTMKPLGKRLTDAPSLKSVPGGHRAQPVFNTRKMSATVTVRPQHAVGLGIVDSGDSDKAREGGKEARRVLVVLVTAGIVKPEKVVPVQPKADETGKIEVQSDEITVDKKTGTVRASGNVKIETAQAVISAAAADITPKKTGAAAAAAKIIFPKIDFRDATLREVVEFLVVKSKALDPAGKGVNVVLGDEGKASDTKITLTLSNIPLSEALRYVASLAGLGLREDEFAIFIGRPQEAVAKPVAGVSGGGGKADTRWIFPKLDFRDATLREAVEFLIVKSKTLDASGTGANILIRNAEKSGAAKITLSVADVPLSEVLRYVAALANCEVTREEFAFIIGPKQAGKIPVPNEDQGKGAPAAARNAQTKGAAMTRAGTIIFPKIDLRDATLSETVEFLRAKSKVLDEDKQGVNLILKRAPAGDDPKITLSLSNIPLSEALRYVAGLAGYELVADEHAITIRPVAK